MSEYIIKKIDAATVPNAPVSSFTLFLDTDGIWKKKDENGVVSSVSEGEAQTLASVLGFGNTTGANDIIITDNQNIKSSTGDTIATWGANTFVINAGNFSTDIAVSNLSLNPLGSSLALFKSDFTTIGFISILENSALPASTGPLPNYPVATAAQNINVLTGVVNSIASGGKNYVVKTDNSNYNNQVVYSKNNEEFELLVNHTTPTADRTQTHQDKNGTIALLSDLLNNRIIVNQSNVSTTLGGVIDSSKEYFIDGIIDLGTTQITVPATGMTLKGYSFDLSGLTSSEDNYTMFISESVLIGSGNVLGSDYYVSVTGTSSKVYEIYDATGFNAFEFQRINYINCTSLGDIYDYRQGLESGTGRFGGSPSLTLHGTWLGGYRITTSIVRSMSDTTTEPLFKEGTSFVMNSRFLSDINCDLGTLQSLLDFQDVNFPNPSTLQLKGCEITRNGVYLPQDGNITPNINQKNLSSFWKGNNGLPNTYVGGTTKVTSEVTTVIPAGSTYYDLEGVFTGNGLQHFTASSDGKLTHEGVNPREFDIAASLVLESTANNDLSVRFVRWNDKLSVFENLDYTEQTRQVNSLVGGRDVAIFTIMNGVVLDQNDFLKIQVRNNNGNNNIVAENSSFYKLSEK